MKVKHVRPLWMITLFIVMYIVMTALFVDHIMSEPVHIRKQIIIWLLYLLVAGYSTASLFTYMREEIVFSFENMKHTALKAGGEGRLLVTIMMLLLVLLNSVLFYYNPENIIAYYSFIYVVLLTGVASILIALNRSIVVITNEYIRNDMKIYDFKQIELITIESNKIQIKIQDQGLKEIRNIRRKHMDIIKEMLMKNEMVSLKEKRQS